MSILDKAKERATQLTAQAKEKVDDFKEQRKVDSLLADLGRITFREHTDRGEASDGSRREQLIAELRQLEAAGTDVTGSGSARAGGAGTTGTPGASTQAEESTLPPPPTPG